MRACTQGVEGVVSHTHKSYNCMWSTDFFIRDAL